MKSKNVVRIIKRRDVRPPACRVDDPRDTILDMERTIKSWVHGVRTNQAIESRIVFSKLFGSKTLR